MSDVFEVVRLTFEEMAFLDVAEGPADPSLVPEGSVLHIEYSRPREGAFSLLLPRSIKFQVAEAIYGEDAASLNPGQLDDSLLELLNVLAGRLLTLQFGSDTVTALGLPTVIFDVPVAPEGAITTWAFHHDADEFRLVTWEAPR